MFQEEGDETDTPCLNQGMFLFRNLNSLFKSGEVGILLEIIFEALVCKENINANFC